MRRQEILDGCRSWNKNDHAGGDADVFYTQFVVPLHERRAMGMFDQAVEHAGTYPEAKLIDRVDIVGAINFEAD